MLLLLCMRPTAKSVGKSRPVDLAFAEDRPPVGQKELALPGQRKSKRGNGAAPAALPQDRPVVATRSVLSRGSDQGYGVIQLVVQEIPATR